VQAVRKRGKKRAKNESLMYQGLIACPIKSEEVYVRLSVRGEYTMTMKQGNWNCAQLLFSVDFKGMLGRKGQIEIIM
jgi:hypothetical protein